MKKICLIISGVLLILFIAGCTNKEKSLEIEKGGDLAKVYNEYYSAFNSEDFDLAFSYLKLDSDPKSFSSDERKVTIDILNDLLIRGIVPVQEIIDNDQGTLIFETQDPSVLNLWAANPDRIQPIPGKRLYGAVHFIKEDDTWKIDHESFTPYPDPRPFPPCIEEEGVKCDIIGYGDIVYHCGHTKSKDDCKQLSFEFDKDYCEMCFAALDNDISLCRDPSWQLYDDCLLNHYFSYHAENADCSMINDSNFRESCEAQHKGDEPWEFIDSDGDGLTNGQEVFFNTSLRLNDTDKDGKTDYEEVMADSNPLGDGRLGDHLN